MMEAETYNIMATNKIIDHRSPEEVKSNLVNNLKMSEANADKILATQKSIIKKDVEKETAVKYQSVLERCGILCELEPVKAAAIDINKLEMEPMEKTAHSDSPYDAPESTLMDSVEYESELASRWSRLGASLLDGMVMMLITVPLMFFTGGFEGIAEGVQPSWQYSMAIGFAGLVAFLLINGWFLVSDGQTLGKKAVGIKIVDLENKLPSKQHLLKRYVTYFIPAQVPVAGGFFSIVNILFIFGRERRCLHDYVGGTRVVSCY